MSLFGGDENDADRRDYGFAFAAFKSSLYLAQVMALRGDLSARDAATHSEMVRDGLSIVPERHLPPAGRAVIEETLHRIEMDAAENFRFK